MPQAKNLKSTTTNLDTYPLINCVLRVNPLPPVKPPAVHLISLHLPVHHHIFHLSLNTTTATTFTCRVVRKPAVDECAHLPCVLADGVGTVTLVERHSRLQIVTRVLLEYQPSIPTHEVRLICISIIDMGIGLLIVRAMSLTISAPLLLLPPAGYALFVTGGLAFMCYVRCDSSSCCPSKEPGG